MSVSLLMYKMIDRQYVLLLGLQEANAQSSLYVNRSFSLFADGKPSDNGSPSIKSSYRCDGCTDVGVNMDYLNVKQSR